MSNNPNTSSAKKDSKQPNEVDSEPSATSEPPNFNQSASSSNRSTRSQPTNPKLKVLKPRHRQKEVAKPWHDMRMFVDRSLSSSRSISTEGSQTDPDDRQADVSEDELPSRTARRLSRVPSSLDPESVNDLPASYLRQRRSSLTPLSYLSHHDDATEQFLEQVAAVPGAALPHEGEITVAESALLEHRDSAEHFRPKRHSAVAGITIEITPPSAIRESNNFILDTVFIEVPDDDTNQSTQPKTDDDLAVDSNHSHAYVVQSLTDSIDKMPAISTVPSTQNVDKVESLPGNRSPEPTLTSVNPTDSMTAGAPPGRRKTKLIAINVRRQTLSAIPRPAKTVRFDQDVERAYNIDEDALQPPDRIPHLWTEELGQIFQTPEQLETESEQPFTPGLLRVYDFSDKELMKIFDHREKFIEEKNALLKFFQGKLASVPPLYLEALDPNRVRAVSSLNSVS
ncbi:hypothetical protein RvY_00725 [Ramazzottius varieornatus]|uniref:Uncharacterized protein n=1 Tax=Ramazzottius varieornatus TaxID=947166 RepID=A0A1D1UHT3_RAMVA|nr:hypothetical protein RvY_00725 [Ramazzottius varieornatus]